ncbi:MAG: hypothetical protein ACK4Z0_08520 [Sphingomonadaceae bacterium]
MKQLVKDQAIPSAPPDRGVPRLRAERISPWGMPQVPRAAALRAAAATLPAEPGPVPAPVERRLARRAEAIWASLPIGPSGLPEAADAERLLAPPFAAQGLLIGLPPHADDAADPAPRVLHLGSALAGLAAASPAGSAALPDAPIVARLVALGLEAVARARPCHHDSDEDGNAPPGGGGLVWRAIALPFAAAPGLGPTALVIASWRRRLSAAETAALHRELAAAIEWMHGQRPKPQSP